MYFMLEMVDSIYQEVVMVVALGTGAAVVTYFKKYNAHKRVYVRQWKGYKKPL